MKIAFVGKYPVSEIISGPEKVAKNLFHHISSLNSESEFITYFFKSNKRQTFKQIFYGCEKISLNPHVKRMGIFKIIAELIKKKIDLVHLITFERFGFIILLLKPFFKYKLVYTIHGIYNYERKIFYNKPGLLSELKDLFLEKLIFAISDKIIFLSPQMIKLAHDYYEFSENRIAIIPNGISINDYPPSKDFNLNGDLEIVFYNGLDVSRKRGIEELASLLSKSGLRNIRLSVLGNPVESNFNRVSFHSPMSESKLFGFMANKHIFIDNLNYMPFSILALEAMALGLILIVSNESGLSSYIRNGENGFVYNSKNNEEVVDILEDITKGKYPLETISKSAVQMAKNLSWDKIANQYYKIYEELLS